MCVWGKRAGRQLAGLCVCVGLCGWMFGEFLFVTVTLLIMCSFLCFQIVLKVVLVNVVRIHAIASFTAIL